jgi:prepilin-type N-terminal cleavage/methylation domain-containing protein
MLARLRRDESGFGLVELLIAMTVLSVGILATIAAFTSGTFALQRAAKLSTATAIADAQMERYRAIRYDAIALTQSSLDAAPADYAADPKFPSDPATRVVVTTCATALAQAGACIASRSNPGPDGRTYRVDTYISLDEQVPDQGSSAAAREVKVVVVVVRDVQDGLKALIRQQSTFDRITGS